MINIEEILSKFEKDVLVNINKDNFMKIINFLINEKCDFIDDIITDYLDLFTFDYEEFIDKYKKLNFKYDNKLLEKVSSDMNILEEFYII